MGPTDQAVQSCHDAGLQRQFDQYFAELGLGSNPYLEWIERQDEIERLSALSDDDLAGLGLHRADIVRHVFDDRFAG